jgi:hypothetical protein
VEVAVVVLQEALAHSQLSNLLVFRHYLDRVSAPFEVKFQSRVSQRVLELKVSVSVCCGQSSKASWLGGDPDVVQGITYIFHLIVDV